MVEAEATRSCVRKSGGVGAMHKCAKRMSNKGMVGLEVITRV